MRQEVRFTVEFTDTDGVKGSRHIHVVPKEDTPPRIREFAPDEVVRRTKDGTLAYSQATGTMATWSSTGSRLYFREPGQTTIHQWDPTGGVSELIPLAQSWLHPVSDAGDDNVAYTVRDAGGLPHVWIYGHGGRSGGELGNVRSSPLFLNAGSLFLVEETPCGANCGLGPQTSPDGKTFVYNLGTQTETASNIASALGSWPRIGQT